MPADERQSRNDLEAQVEAELGMARSYSREELIAPEVMLPFDPTAVERQEAGLRGLRGALEAMPDDPEPDESPEI